MTKNQSRIFSQNSLSRILENLLVDSELSPSTNLSCLANAVFENILLTELTAKQLHEVIGLTEKNPERALKKAEEYLPDMYRILRDRLTGELRVIHTTVSQNGS